MKLKTLTNPLTIAEKTTLKAYHFTDRKKEGMIQASSLLNPKELKAFIEEIKPLLKTDSAKVAASVFIKRYSFLAVLSLYSVSAWNKKLDIRPENIHFEAPTGRGMWLPKFYFTNMEAQKWGGEDWDTWRKAAVQELFAGHIYPLIELLGKVTGVSKLILWENVAVYIMWLYESELAEKGADLDFLFNKAEGSVFGDYHRNPIKKFFAEKTYIEDLDEMVRVRKTCCFSYLTGDKDTRCKTCRAGRSKWRANAPMEQTTFVKQFEALLEKYAELLVGQSDEETTEKVKMYALYTHIAKTMPALAQHWNSLYPDAKDEMRMLMLEIKELNQKHREAKRSGGAN